mgnify:FL=1|tara:strand:- start:1277 stop:1480 length:204 start_codon:yes stop_codon:yes gene_type:complete
MIRVEGHSHLYRDETTGAIINCDDSGYDQYVKSLNYRKNQKEELNNMKRELEDIKSLLKILVDDKNK